MSQIETAVTLSRRLESLLEEKHQATGKGLHEKVSSVEAKLSPDLVKSLRYIATMRNSVVHEDGFVIDDLAGFSAQGDAALAQLGGKPMNAGTPAGRLKQLQGFMGIACILLSGIAGAYFTAQSMGTVGSAVGGFIGGAFIGAWILSWLGKALEFVFGLFIIGCAISVLVAFLQWAGIMHG
jgi:hypothetical protein